MEINSIRNYSRSDAFDFMFSSWAPQTGISMGAFLINYVLAILMIFKDKIVKPIFSVLITADFIVLAAIKDVMNILENLFGYWAFILILAIFAGLVWSFIGTEGGVLVLISLGIWLFHLLIFLIIMWVADGGLVRALPTLGILAVLAVVLFVVCYPSNSESSSSSESSGGFRRIQ